jgi:hypothetical protein
MTQFGILKVWRSFSVSSSVALIQYRPHMHKRYSIRSLPQRTLYCDGFFRFRESTGEGSEVSNLDWALWRSSA